MSSIWESLRIKIKSREATAASLVSIKGNPWPFFLSEFVLCSYFLCDDLMWPQSRLHFKQTHTFCVSVASLVVAFQGVGDGDWVPATRVTHIAHTKPTHTHTRARTQARSKMQARVRWSSWLGRAVGRQEEELRPPLPCHWLAGWLAGSQFGSHEVDVRFDQWEEWQAPLELCHVLHQRGLETRVESLFSSCFSLL